MSYYSQNREEIRRKQRDYYYANHQKIRQRQNKNLLHRDRIRTIYDGIIARCYVSSHKAFGYYGGRGIRMCHRWLNSYEVFKEWLLASGWKQGLHVHRADNDGDYSPENCQIITAAEHLRINPKLTKLTWEEVSEIRHLHTEGFKTSDLAEKFGISRGQLYKIVTNRSWIR